jgi:hypothetical protein
MELIVLLGAESDIQMGFAPRSGPACLACSGSRDRSRRCAIPPTGPQRNLLLLKEFLDIRSRRIRFRRADPGGHDGGGSVSKSHHLGEVISVDRREIGY